MIQNSDFKNQETTDSRDELMIEDPRPSGLENVYIGLANGEHLWADMTFFQSWNSRRHCRTHIFCGILTILFGFFVVFFNPFDRLNYGTQVIAGIFYFVAGVFSIGFKSPRATARICTLTTFVGIFVIIEILGKKTNCLLKSVYFKF